MEGRLGIFAFLSHGTITLVIAIIDILRLDDRAEADATERWDIHRSIDFRWLLVLLEPDLPNLFLRSDGRFLERYFYGL